MTNKYRADHVGSLLRPRELVDARNAYFRDHSITEEQLAEAEDKAILKVLDLQREAGLGVFTDGEYRRAIFADLWNPDKIEGLTLVEETPDVPYESMWQGEHTQEAGASQREMVATGQSTMLIGSYVTGKLRAKERLRAHESGFLTKHSPGPAKITFLGMGWGLGTQFKPGVSDKFYADTDEVKADMTKIFRDELAAVIDEGVAYIQLDSLGYLLDPGVLTDEVMDAMIAADNASIEGLDRSKVTIGLHMCRGNNMGTWVDTGTYDHLEKAFHSLNVDRFLLEFDTERAGPLEPLKLVPKDKQVALGLITTKQPELESMDTLRRRVDEAAKYMPVENMAIAPQCGFASSYFGNYLTWDDMKRKLELTVRAADELLA